MESALEAGWELASAPPGAFERPEGLEALAWHVAEVPGTVASALGPDALEGHVDAVDWWYRTRFAVEGSEGARHVLRFEGLATLATVWLNGEPILDTQDMFVAYRVDVTGRLEATNELCIRFAALEPALAAKRPRAKWRTALVRQQNLRWYRTTLLGRMPGWNPLVPAVGPWAPVVLETHRGVALEALRLAPRLEGTTGRVDISAQLRPSGAARLVLGDRIHDLAPDAQGRIEASLDAGTVPAWWPHTHGEPARVGWRLEVRGGSEWRSVREGHLGFRDVVLDDGEGPARFRVNGVGVFCRGACWTPVDFARLRASPAGLRAALEALREAGANMVRVGGTMAYESDDFYALCDELGLLVWQDFMFANFDYPVADASFHAIAIAEARAVVSRLARFACMAVYCGGSEVAQQAAMMGLPAERWSNDFFRRELPALAAELHPGVPYVPSSPWGGALPFHVGQGIAHYYGVGAYRRPLTDVRVADVQFASECLGFSHVPEPEPMARDFGSPTPAPHSPAWKAGVARDMGAAWDFEDIRDHYLGVLFGVDVVALRTQDLERYYALSRRVPGEVAARVYAEWRRAGSGCSGGLVWLWRDVRPGAGWGVVGRDGEPKSTYWYLKRAWAPRSLHLTDEGLDGVAIHVRNDREEMLEATVELVTLAQGRLAMAPVRQAVAVAPHGVARLSGDALVGFFADLANAYRFGPPKHDVVAARLLGADGRVLSEDYLFPTGYLLPMHTVTPRAAVEREGEAGTVVVIESAAFLQSVAVAAEGWVPDDNYFHVLPGVARRVTFRPQRAGVAFEAELRALNLPGAIPVARKAAPL